MTTVETSSRPNLGPWEVVGIEESEPEGVIDNIGFDLYKTLVDVDPEFIDTCASSISRHFNIAPEVALAVCLKEPSLQAGFQIEKVLRDPRIAKFDKFSDEQVERVTEEIDSELDDLVGGLFTDTEPTLREFKSEGKTLFVVSNVSEAGTWKKLVKFGLDRYIPQELALGRDSISNITGKREDHFEEIARRLKMPYRKFRRSTAYVGDGISDIGVGNYAGIEYVVGLSYGSAVYEAKLKGIGADDVAASLTQFRSLVTARNERVIRANQEAALRI